MPNRQELTPLELRAFYNRFGRLQDRQGFYEDPATSDLISHANFEKAQQVFELGCGTGRFAASLLANYLPANANYFATDITPKMLDLAKERLARWPERVQVEILLDPTAPLPPANGSVDRFVSNYVFDLLSEDLIQHYLKEAHRILAADGLLCLVSLSNGISLISRLVAAAWTKIYSLQPRLVGGCHPVNLLDYLSEKQWNVQYQKVITAFGIPSQIIVALPIK